MSSLAFSTPERVIPDLERLREAVDVLGDAKLRDPGGLGGLQVAVGVLLGEVLGGRRISLVRPKVEVVVGEHPGRTYPPPDRFASAASR